MSAGALLGELRERGIRLEVNGLTLLVDAPAEADTDDLRGALRENKRALIRLLERERKKLQDADRRGLVIRWAREPGHVAIHDPTTGEWHELKASECLPSVVESARANRRGRDGG